MTISKDKEILRKIQHMREAYRSYSLSLKAVLDCGESSIIPLISNLDDKFASPVAKALGLLMHEPAAKNAFPRLLDWLAVQSPIYPDVLEALVSAGPSVLPLAVERIHKAAVSNDDEAVRNIFDLLTRIKGPEARGVVTLAIGLLSNSNPHVREAAADAIWSIGLPLGKDAKHALNVVLKYDPSESVRKAACEALEKIGSSS